MQTALDQLRLNIAYVRNIGGIHSSVRSMTTPALDLSDILRAQLVMCVSALDHYIHEVARIGMLQTFDGKRPATPAFLRYDVSIESVLQALTSAATPAWLDTEVRDRHAYLSFQQPDRIADAIRLISPIELWKSLGLSMKDKPKNLKTRLQLIVQRRNKIVHEADIDPTSPHPGGGAHFPYFFFNYFPPFGERLCGGFHLLL